MLKRFSCAALFLCAILLLGGEAKYVFLMIGDGFGENSRQVFLSQYPDAVLGKLGEPIPTGTLNVEGKTTDSAASGTAIACGVKTRNGRVGLDANDRPVMSLAKVLQRRGYKIGLISSVGINDATPGAHAGNRMRGEIGIASDLYTNHINFLGISKVLCKDDATFNHFCKQGLSRAGYAISKNGTLEGLKFAQGKKKGKAGKAAKMPKYMAVFASSPIAWEDWDGVSAKPVPTLAGFTAMAAKVLDNPKGFFIMVEGGAIDHGNHGNDAGTMVHEAREFDLAIAEALKFQAAHPEDTLIVVTADHETGGLQIIDKNAIQPGFAAAQKLPRHLLSKGIGSMLKENKSEAEIISWLCEQIGLKDLTAAESAKLSKELKAVIAKQTTGKDKMTGYGNYNRLVIAAFQIRDARNGIKYTTFGHTQTKVSTFAKGAGAELFKAPQENSDLPHRISIAMLGDDKDLSSGITPLPYMPSAVDYLEPRTACTNALMFQFGTVGNKVPQKLELKDASGNVIKTVPCKDICGFEKFDGLTPDTEYTLEMTKADGSVQKAAGRTLPQPKGKKLFSFVVLSDMHYSCHGDIPYGRMIASSAKVLRNIVKFANDRKIPVMINPGDVADASLDKEYAEYASIAKEYTGTNLMTPGNHDRKGDGYDKAFGKGVGIQTINGVQFVWLATGGPKTGFLGKKPQNAEVMKKYDPNRPAVIFTHYQLTKDAMMRDKDRAIHDQDKAPNPQVQAMLDKIASSKAAVIYIGHKNTATDVKLGNCWQINCPQPTQFPCGFLLVDVYEDGLLQHYIPALDARMDEYSRRLTGGTEKHRKSRDGRSFQVWNRFIPMEIAK